MIETARTLDHVTVIVVTYNSRHCIADLAASLIDFPHLIFSDNASHDGTPQAIATALPHAKLLVHEANLGFGAANNRALAYVQTPFAMLLNPDCEISAVAVQGLMDYLQQDPEAAVAAPQIVRSHGALEIGYRWPSVEWRSTGPAAHAPCCVGFVTGAAMLLRMARCRDTGFFDEDFFLYYEDDDLCLRLFKAKRSIVLVPQVRLIHASRGSVRGNHPLRAEYLRGYHHAQSKILYAHKHRSAQHARRLMWRTWAAACVGLPFRLMLPVPRLVARWCGRIAGSWAMRVRMLDRGL
jgi:N-acetylglucosaminyl-diphospho-decaprenol L-rhamnosyltransferase